MAQNLDPEGIETIAHALRQLRVALEAYRIVGRFDIVFEDPRTCDYLRDCGRQAFAAGLVSRDPARRLSDRQLVRIAGVPFVSRDESPVSQALVRDAMKAIQSLQRPGLRKADLDALDLLDRAVLELGKYQRK